VALHCIRCSACLNACPVYSRVGGHAYESVYPGPIGAILTPQMRHTPSLPFASSLCGACYDACPVKIDIPSTLIHLRAKVGPSTPPMRVLGRVFASRLAYERAQRLARLGRGPLARVALRKWTRARELPEVPPESFRSWWKQRQ
jgi:L-lactate dehydrogenase complex protein LldF